MPFTILFRDLVSLAQHVLLVAWGNLLNICLMITVELLVADNKYTGSISQDKEKSGKRCH